jgi:hypothetical protein
MVQKQDESCHGYVARPFALADTNLGLFILLELGAYRLKTQVQHF